MTGVTRRDFLAGSLLAPFAGAVSGCALFQKSAAPLHTSASKLPPISLPPNAIQFDVVFVERPVGDRLLGQLLWQHIDEAISVERQTRTMLRQHGFRAGVTASNPPVALQRMLNLKTDFAYAPADESAKLLVGEKVIVSSGGQTELVVSRLYPECSFELPAAGGARQVNLQNVRCAYRMTAERMQHGWVQLTFVPQVQHGDNKLRYAADDAGLRFQQGQKTEVLHSQRFQLKLSVGEFALVTSTDDADGKLGGLFFRGPSAVLKPEVDPETGEAVEPAELTPGVQRLLVIRLSGVQSPDEAQAG